MRRRAPKIHTQKEVLWYLTRLRPRYALRVPLKCKHDPCIARIEDGDSIAGEIVHVRQATYIQLRNKGRLKLRRKVENKTYSFIEYTIAGKRKRRKR